MAVSSDMYGGRKQRARQWEKPAEIAQTIGGTTIEAGQMAKYNGFLLDVQTLL